MQLLFVFLKVFFTYLYNTALCVTVRYKIKSKILTIKGFQSSPLTAESCYIAILFDFQASLLLTYLTTFSSRVFCFLDFTISGLTQNLLQIVSLLQITQAGSLFHKGSNLKSKHFVKIRKSYIFSLLLVTCYLIDAIFHFPDF